MSRPVTTVALIAASAVAAVAAVLMLSSSEPAAKLYGQWSMTTEGDTVPSLVGAEPLTLYGPWRPTRGVVGEAIEFSGGITAYGIAHGTEPDNAGSHDFAMGVTFTSESPEAGVGFSGNVMQKGRANEQGQVKLSVLPTPLGGATFCRVKGTNGFKLLKSKVIIDDGAFHTAVCWREAATIGLTVDGETLTLGFDAGTVTTDEPVRIANQAAEGSSADQHLGRNDCSVWVIGAGARELALASTPC
jgi:hypothetical protein